MCIEAKYCDDQKFQSHDFTSWPRIFEMFLDNLPKMQDTKNMNWLMHLELDWEYFTSTSKKMEKHFWPSPQPFTKTRNQWIICSNPYEPKGMWQLGTY